MIISLAGIIDSLKITLMVGASIFMITYMGETSALKRIIVFIKTLRGSHRNALSLDPMTIATANSVGDGLVSVITPAKVQNTAATIYEIGIEGRVIRKTILIALMMIMLLSGVTIL